MFTLLTLERKTLLGRCIAMQFGSVKGVDPRMGIWLSSAVSIAYLFVNGFTNRSVGSCRDLSLVRLITVRLILDTYGCL